VPFTSEIAPITVILLVGMSCICLTNGSFSLWVLLLWKTELNVVGGASVQTQDHQAIATLEDDGDFATFP